MQLENNSVSFCTLGSFSMYSYSDGIKYISILKSFVDYDGNCVVNLNTGKIQLSPFDLSNNSGIIDLKIGQSSL